jgi:hypothetical protein
MTEAPATTEAPTEEPAATEAATEEAAAGAGALVSVKADQAPGLDGDASDAAWGNVQAVTIPVTGGANDGSTEVSIRSVYTDDMVFFLATWADPTQSWERVPWEKQEDGTWMKLADPNDKGGDNNLYYEDKLAFIWPTNNSIPNFDTQGCFSLPCRREPDKKPTAIYTPPKRASWVISGTGSPSAT